MNDPKLQTELSYTRASLVELVEKIKNLNDFLYFNPLKEWDNELDDLKAAMEKAEKIIEYYG